MISFELGIALTIIIKLTECQLLTYGNYNFNIPVHTYKITCESDTVITGSVTWNGKSDLDVRIYNQGTDLLSQNTIQRFEQRSVLGESIFSVAPLAGTYYIKIYPYSLKQIELVYQLTIVITSPLQIINKTGQFYYYFPNNNGILISNTQSWNSLKYTIQTNQSISVQLYNQNNPIPYSLTAGQTFCLPTNITHTNLTLVIKDSLTSAFNLQSIIFILYNDQSNSTGCLQSNKTQINCTNQNCSSSSIVPIIVGVIGGVIGVVIIVVVIVCCYRKYNQKQQAKRISIGDNILSSNQMIRIDENLACSICLQPGCNSTLPCMHSYHKDCITLWMKKNIQCPLCRELFTKSKINNL